jgi:hypothetical protein
MRSTVCLSDSAESAISQKGLAMKIYLTAVVIALGATTVIVNACLLNTSSARAVPINIVHFR